MASSDMKMPDLVVVVCSLGGLSSFEAIGTLPGPTVYITMLDVFPAPRFKKNYRR